MKIVAHKGRHKLQDKWEPEEYVVVEQPIAGTPVYRLQPVTGGNIRTLHRNLLLPLGVKLEPDYDSDDSILDEDDSSSDESVIPEHTGISVVLLHCGCLSLNPFIEFRIRKNSSSSDVLYIKASISISPKCESKSKTTSHCHLLLHDCTNAAVQHLLKLMLLQNTILQQPSTPPIQSCFKSQKPKCNSNAYGYHRLNVVNTSQSARMPRFLVSTAIYVSKMGPKTSQE